MAALALADRRFKVFGTTRRANSGKIGGVVDFIEMDVTDDCSVAVGVAAVLAKAGHIDVLVNNAGIGIAGGAVESSISQAQAIFNTNFFGAIRLIRAVVPHMRERHARRIVNISSVQGFLPAPYM